MEQPYDSFGPSRENNGAVVSVIPAKAGIHLAAPRRPTMDPGFHRDGDKGQLAKLLPMAANASVVDVPLLNRAAQDLSACIFPVVNRQNATIRRVSTFVSLAVLFLGLALIAAPGTMAEPTAEVLHWWTSGGEARALKVIADRFTQSGGRWIDSPIAGGGGDAARTVAKTRMIGGKPPTIMQWHLGLSLRQLAESGLLGEVDEVARAGNWDKVLPPLLVANAKIDGHYVTIPVDIHGENWLWTNSKVLASTGVAVPRNWPEFNAAADKLRAAGYIPLALGGQGWQQVIVFSAVTLGTGGAEFFRRAFVDLDPQALGGPEMVAVFAELRLIKAMIDPGASNRDWNEATNLVITGKAGMQLMGDWAKGEFVAAGLEPEHDFGCDPTPGAGAAYVIAADSLAVPKLADPAQRQGQILMAKTAMDETVQRDFSLAKGSIPARNDVPQDAFDLCARKAMTIVRESKDLLPAIGSSMGIGAAEAGAITDAVSLFFARDMTAEEGAKALAAALAGTR
jgi:glucose/mannose transport system substrate-binding protein